LNFDPNIPSRRSTAPDDVVRMIAALPDAEQSPLREAWDVAGDPRPVPDAVSANAWTRLLASMNRASSKAAVRSRAPRVPAPLRLLRLTLASRLSIAASVALLLAVGYALRPTTSVYRSQIGEGPMSVELSDGSAVQLAPGTVLRVPEQFGSINRTVDLDGEAFFDVTSADLNQGLPFEIKTFNASVEVLGTAFNVRARRGDWESATEVVVERGSVRVASADLPAMSVVLEPGEGTQVEEDATPSRPVEINLERVLTWRSGGLAFSNAPMGAVFDELQRRYGVVIESTPAIRSISVSYWRDSNVGVDEMLADLADVVDVGFRRTSSGYRLFETDL
jgi:transmembrane sensor